MRLRLLINIILLLAVTGLTLFLVYKPANEPALPDVQLTSISPAAINRIIIRQPQGTLIEFEKTDGQWFMQQPYALPANPARINTMLKLPGAHSYTQIRKDETDLARFLLDNPALSVRFNETEIAFGDNSPIAEQRYVLVNDTVHLINDSLFEQLQAPATFFLSTRLLPADAIIHRLIFPELSIHKQNDLWQTDPATDISTDQITRAVQAWQQLEAIALREYMPGENHGTVSIDLDNQVRLEFVIVSPPPQLILGRADLGLQYHISGYDAEQLFPHPVTHH